MDTWIIVVATLLLALLLLRVAIVVLRRGTARARLREELHETIPEAGDEGSIARWLFLAGYRHPRAAARFWWLQVAALLAGLAVASTLSASNLIAEARAAAEAVPGGIGVAAGPVIDLTGVLVVLLFSAAPLLIVRAARRKRVNALEQDLPVALELLASLARAGLGFDAAVQRILVATSEEEPRPLAQELGAYRGDVLSGLPREASYARLADRTATPGVDVFVAALTHSERLGVGLSDTLRRQADELWSQRRERALARAQTLPARLAGPLIICFLPGLLIVTLGPALVAFWETLTGVTGGAG